MVAGIVLLSFGALLMTGASNASAQPSAQSSSDPTIASYNWAGYAATGASGSVALVNGSWVEPTIACPTIHPTTLASIWVGIDGYPSASSTSTVEAVGTTARCLSGHPAYLAWYEIYPAPPVVFMTVSAGDTIHAQVIPNPNPPFPVIFVFRDVTNNTTYSTTQLASPTAPLSSAECIVQRVLSSGLEYASPALTSGPAPPFAAFTHFTAVTFSYCTAHIGSAGPIGIATFPAAHVFHFHLTKVGATTFARTSVATGPFSTYKVKWKHF